jgi:hypothetical protein
MKADDITAASTTVWTIKERRTNATIPLKEATCVALPG